MSTFFAETEFVSKDRLSKLRGTKLSRLLCFIRLTNKAIARSFIHQSHSRPPGKEYSVDRKVLVRYKL
ncbi:MAG: hypothetical protein ACYTXA_04925 [Nostoc sp.]